MRLSDRELQQLVVGVGCAAVGFIKDERLGKDFLRFLEDNDEKYGFRIRDKRIELLDVDDDPRDDRQDRRDRS